MERACFYTSSAQDTIKLAGKIASLLKKGDVIGLFGELGSGKTTFVKGLAEGLGLKHNINSPSFVILKIYTFAATKLRPSGRGWSAAAQYSAQGTPGFGSTSLTIPREPSREESRNSQGGLHSLKKNRPKKRNVSLCHFDLYRLRSLKELEDTGYEDFIDSDALCVIEWADRADRLLPKNYLKINIKIKTENSRIIDIAAYGDRYSNLLSRIKA